MVQLTSASPSYLTYVSGSDFVRSVPILLQKCVAVRRKAWFVKLIC